MPSAKPKSLPTPAADPLAAIADELGALEKEIAPFKSKLARIDALRAAIRAPYEASPASEGYQVTGTRYVVAVGERGMQRTIDIGKLYKAIRAAAFLKIATVTMKALEREVDAAIAAQVVSENQTGPRSIKIFEKGVIA